jgi:autotransporter-associated beta strand protein
MTALPIAKVLFGICLLASVSAFGAVKTFDGGDAINPLDIGLKTNWSGDTLPVNGDVGEWNGTVSGDLALTYSTGLNLSSGFSISLTSGQTGNISLDGNGSNPLIRFQNFTNKSSSAAFTIASSGDIQMVLGSPATHYFVNNSAGTVTIGPKVTWTMGGGGTHTLNLEGTGNFAISNYLHNVNTSGQVDIRKNNAGTLILDPTGGKWTTGAIGTTTVNSNRLIIGGIEAFIAGRVPAYSIDGFTYGAVVVNTNGVLDLNGISTVVNSFSGSRGTVDNTALGAATLTVGANGGGGTFSGTIKNTGGALTLVVAGTNTLTLSGTNTYTGGTVITNTATLLISGDTGGNILIGPGASIGGSGTVGGNWDLSDSTSRLTLVNGQLLTFTGTATFNNNTVVVNVPGGSPLGTGTYTLMNYTPANVTGSVNTTPVFTGAGVAPGSTYSVSMSGGAIVLTVSSTTTVSVWTNSVSGNWSVAANWSSNPNVPGASAGDVASLGVGSAFTTVTLDIARTLGSLTFTNGNSFAIANAGNTLTLNNSGNGAVVNVTGGSSNSIGAPVALSESAAIAVNTGTALAISNTISGAGLTLTKNGGGTLSLYGNNTFGSLTLNAGTLEVGSSGATGAGDLAVSNNATLAFRAPLNFTKTIMIDNTRTLSVNDSGNAVTLGSRITGAGGLTKVCAGTTTITNILNDYTGTTLVSTGTLVLANSGVTYANMIQASGNGTVLQIPAGKTINVTTPNNGNLFVDQGATLQVDSGAFLSFTGVGFSGIGNTIGAPVSSLIVNGGSLYYSANIALARNSSAIATISNNGVLSNGVFYVGQTASGTGTLNLDSGGTLIANQVNSINGTGNLLYFNGGKVKSTGLIASSLFWPNVSSQLSVYVRNSGGTIDNGGASNRIQQPFLHSTVPGDNAVDGGMTFTGTGGSVVFENVTHTYTGPTIIADGTVELTNSVFSSSTTLSISNSAVLQLDDVTTNSIAGLILGGVAQAGGLYSSNEVPVYITGPGYLLVQAAGPIAPTNSPTITNFSLANVSPSGGNVVLSGTNGNTGATYYLLGSTNVANPLSQWKTVATNVAAGNAFSFTATNAVFPGAAQQFFILSSTNYNP